MKKARLAANLLCGLMILMLIRHQPLQSLHYQLPL